VAVWRSAGTELGEGRVTDFAYLWQNFRGWLHITMYRLETYYFYSLEVWLAVGLCAFLLPQRYPMRARLGFFCLMLIAGLSWTYLMRQHTSIHDFTGGYSYFAWMICFGLFFGTCHRILKTSANALEQRLKPLVIVVAVAWVMPNLNKFILVDWLDLWARLFS
jgi:hypothetical protein